MRLKAGSKSGQALIIAILVLIVLLLMSQYFATLVIRNLTMAGSGINRSTAQRLAEAGVDYALFQLRSGYIPEAADPDKGRFFPCDWKKPDNDAAPVVPGDETINIDGGSFKIRIINPYCPKKYKNDPSSEGLLDTRPGSTPQEYDAAYNLCKYTDASGSVCAHPAYVKIISTGTPEGVLNISKTIEAIVAVAPVYNEYMRFIGSDTLFKNNAALINSGLYGSGSNALDIQPAPIYVLGNATWDVSIPYYLDARINRVCRFECTGKLKNPPVVNTAIEGFSTLQTGSANGDSAYYADNSYCYNGLSFFDMAHMPYYIYDGNQYNAIGRTAWFDDGDFILYAVLAEKRGLWINNSADTSDSWPTPVSIDGLPALWTGFPAVSDNWEKHDTDDPDGDKVPVFNPPAVELIFNGDRVTVQERFSAGSSFAAGTNEYKIKGAVADPNNLKNMLLDDVNKFAPAVIYINGDVRIRGYVTKPVTVVSNRCIYLDKGISAPPAGGHTVYPALIARNYITVNTTQMFYYYGRVTDGKELTSFDEAASAPDPLAIIQSDRWQLNAADQSVTFKLLSSSSTSNSRLVIDRSTGGAAPATAEVQIKVIRHDGTESIFSDNLNGGVSRGYKSITNLNSVKEVELSYKAGNCDYNIHQIQLFHIPVDGALSRLPVEAMMISYSNSLFVIPGNAGSGYSTVLDGGSGAWGIDPPAGFKLDFKGTLAEKTLESAIPDWEASWLPYITNTYDCQSVRNFKNLSPYLPKLVRVISWITR